MGNDTMVCPTTKNSVPQVGCRGGGFWAVLLALLVAVTAYAARASDESPPAPEAENGSQAAGEDASERPGEKWVRLLRDKNGEPLAMQTAVVRYSAREQGAESDQKPVTVDLIGAIHVGDRKYYEGLNKRFEEYDALLYELVAPEGTVVERGRGTSNAHPVGAIQNGLKAFLDLEHQLEHVDYKRGNFVHADMSPEQFSQTMQQRGESFTQMYFRLLGQELARQSQQQAAGKSAEFELFSAFFSQDRERRLKVALASQFEDMEGMLAAFGGPDGSTIITERNRVALEVLAKQLEAGKRNLGIFYGAGHLADMDERLREEFHLEPVQVTWIDAWDLRP